mmetsp:Transcript_65325/g.75109  ORF Transcript_65325/g.75109 Transcript_65325/m.75109 type:complete len:85 (+) Transcript_65325:564-818(+)
MSVFLILSQNPQSCCCSFYSLSLDFFHNIGKKIISNCFIEISLYPDKKRDTKNIDAYLDPASFFFLLLSLLLFLLFLIDRALCS